MTTRRAAAGTARRRRRRAGAAPADYAAVKDYLAEHTARLVTETGKLREGAQQYHDLAESVDFDYDALLSEHADEVAPIIEKLQTDFRAANPAYEEMEGVVAGVPELADYDVTIDAGGDASDPENAVPFTIKTKAGKEYKQPGNFFFITETAIFGTEDKFAAKGVEPDLDGDGEISFGESLPDADFLQAATVDFEQTAKDLQASGEKWTPGGIGRLHRRRRHDADDVGVLRGMEELALRRRVEGDGVRLRRRVAPRGHRLDPQRPRRDLRQHRAADRRGGP